MIAWAFACVSVAVLGITPGWENVNPGRREFPPAKVVWTAPSDGFSVEKLDGATGEVTVSDGAVVVRKTNDKGTVVVSVPAGKVAAGGAVRFFADVEARTRKPDDAYGRLLAWTGKRNLSQRDAIAAKWFLSGGEHMRKLVNSAPDTPYRKYCHLAETGDDATVAIVVSGAPSESTWRRLAAEDLAAAQAKWDEHFARLASPDRRADLQPLPAFEAGLAADNDHWARVETRDGVSRLVVDGQVVPPIVYKACEWGTGDRLVYSGKPLQAAGVTVGILNIQLGLMPSGEGVWSKRGFDVEKAVEKVRNAMRLGDKSLFLLALGTSAYPEFTETEHPDQVWIKEDGSVAIGNSGSVIPDRYNDGGKADPGDRRWPWASYASPVWRQAIAGLTERLFAELKRTGLMKRVIGVHYYGYHDGQFAMPILDYSPCAKAEYAAYLKERGLTEKDREGTYAFFSKQLGFRALEEMSRAAKRLAGKPIVSAKWVMSPFQISFDLTSFVRSDAVDILVPRPSYHRRLPGLCQGVAQPMESLHLNGKLQLMEFDFRTYGARDVWAQSVIATKGLNSAEDLTMWRTVIRKNAALMNAHRMGWWLYDMGGGFYSPPEIVEDFKPIYDLRRELDVRTPDPWRPDVAYVIDEAAIASYNTPYGPKVASVGSLAMSQGMVTAASGVPYDIYLAEDFYRNPDLAKRYKAIALCGFIEPDAKQQALVARIGGFGVKTFTVKSGGFSARFFHDFAQAAGAFVAAEPDVLQLDMNGDFLSAHCLVPGTYEVRLPFDARIVNMKDGSESSGRTVPLTMTAGETCWFRLYRRTSSRVDARGSVPSL